MSHDNQKELPDDGASTLSNEMNMRKVNHEIRRSAKVKE